MLVASFLILVVVGVAGLLVYNRLNMWQASREQQYARREEEAKERLAAALQEKRELESRLLTMENEVSLAGWRLQAPPQPQHAGGSPVKMPKRTMTAEERNERLSRWLLKNGKISIEQHEKAQKLVGQIGNDIVETCLLLRFIDPETAKDASGSI